MPIRRTTARLLTRIAGVLITLANTILTPPPAVAAPPAPALEAVSQGSIRIQVSVAPRVHLRWSPSGEGTSRDSGTSLSCTGSTAMVITLRRASGVGAGQPLSTIVLPAGRSRTDCRGSIALQDQLATLAKDRSEGPYLLLVSPQ